MHALLRVPSCSADVSTPMKLHSTPFLTSTYLGTLGPSPAAANGELTGKELIRLPAARHGAADTPAAPTPAREVEVIPQTR